MAAKYYAWSELRNGGEMEEIKLPAGGVRRIITKRNSVPFGDAVTKAKLGCTDEEWDRLIEIGSVRSYAPPEGVSDYVSPAGAFVNQFTNDQGDIDVSRLMELGLAHPTVNPSAEASEEIPAGA
jgi:hypothetical protein